MNREEALRFAKGEGLELLLEMEVCGSETKMKRLNEKYDFISFARACIEKEIPLQACNISISDEGICGNCTRCGRKLVFTDGFGRCPECGQAIEWSGTP